MPTTLYRHRPLVMLACVIGVSLSARQAAAQATLADSLNRWIRQAYTAGAPEAVAIWREIGWNGVGFGFRSFGAREAAADAPAPSLEAFAAGMEYYRIKLDELHTRMDGDIGLVWGVHTEEFKVKGQPAEAVRVRFTNTLRWTGSAWKNLLYHRDAQPFNANGRYIRAPQ